MKKAGEIFRQERERQGLKISKVVEKTKIPQEFLIALEADDYSRLPKGVYPQLYVREYARFLGLSEEKMAAIFRRDYHLIKEEKNRLFWLKLDLSPRKTKFLAAGLIIFLFVAYLGYQYFNFVRPPKIKINSVESSSEGLIIRGKTSPQASLKIDDQVVNLDSRGRFNYLIKNGKAAVVFEVQSPAGRKKIIEYQLPNNE